MEANNILNLAESRGTLESYSAPQEKSSQDGTNFKYKELRLSLWKARYAYAPKRNGSNSRDFCKKMVGIAKNGTVYRMEDIKKMGRDGINSELAASGQTNYSIWLFKGGAACHHYWERHIYVRKWNAVAVPSWLQYLGSLSVPKMTNRYAQAATYLFLKGSGMSDDAVRSIFVKIIDFPAFMDTTAKGYFSNYVTGLNIPAAFKTVLFSRYGNTTGTIIKFIKGVLRGRALPVAAINSKLAALPAALDFADAGILYENIKFIFKAFTISKDRKIGYPESRSKTEKLENDEEIGVRDARRRAIKYPVNDPRVNTKPINMPNKGFMSGRSAYRKQRIVSEIKKLL